MKIAELVETLSQFDPEDEVLIGFYQYDGGGDTLREFSPVVLIIGDGALIVADVESNGISKETGAVAA